VGDLIAVLTSLRFRGYLRTLFVQAAWVVLVRVKCWERYGLKSWIEAAKKRLHHNVLAIALANKLARIAWAVLAKGRSLVVLIQDQIHFLGPKSITFINSGSRPIAVVGA
jgi:transposase